jgi:pilus assembly protein CpaF
MDQLPPADRLDAVAEDLRLRLIADAHAGDGIVPDVTALLEREGAALAAPVRDALTRRIAELALGLGPIDPLLRDPLVDEVLVSGTEPIWVERRGRLEPTTAAFATEEALRHAIERLLTTAGRRADDAAPICDARLPDGSRVNVVLPPVAVDGPSLTIRRFRPRGLTPEQLVACGSWTPALAELLEDAVARRQTILVSGATSSGKTTALGALAWFLGPGERVVTIEDTAELRLPGDHVVRLEARAPGHDGRGEVTIRDLVRAALRMRPDRIVVGEVRGGEALDMLSALATGHAGSLGTIHAGSPAEALRRLETLALLAGTGVPHAALRDQVADAIDLVVHLVRGSDGVRRVTSVGRVERVGGGAAVREVYRLRGGRPVVLAA